jgi:hypothetical protein
MFGAICLQVTDVVEVLVGLLLLVYVVFQLFHYVFVLARWFGEDLGNVCYSTYVRALLFHFYVILQFLFFGSRLLENLQGWLRWRLIFLLFLFFGRWLLREVILFLEIFDPGMVEYFD